MAFLIIKILLNYNILIRKRGGAGCSIHHGTFITSLLCALLIIQRTLPAVLRFGRPQKIENEWRAHALTKICQKYVLFREKNQTEKRNPLGM